MLAYPLVACQKNVDITDGFTKIFSPIGKNLNHQFHTSQKYGARGRT